MKDRTSPKPAGRGPEFKGVVKKITGKLTSDASLEREGREEMLGPKKSISASRDRGRRRANPDPHRRG
jgi:uncharacterized protein YjbJ (UPF0337 family)